MKKEKMNSRSNRLKKCEMCEKLISSTEDHPVCMDCSDQDSELFEKTKNLLKYGEKISAAELAARSGIEKKHIERWVNTGRLSSARHD
jgi:Fe-S-cluster-containing dehydrogenase component